MNDQNSEAQPSPTSTPASQVAAQASNGPGPEAHQHSFQAEVSQVLSLVVNSLYSNKEIFLRELISNASDAIDKLRFRSLSDQSVALDGEPKISLVPNAETKTLTIEDNGIGMSRDEMVDNLGTIARSGTREFAKQLEAAAQAKKEGSPLIGQFGVGFYSSFLVANRVEVVSRAAGSDQAHRWISDAKESFTIEPAERAQVGTTVILHLKEEESDFANAYRLREVVRRHSDYVGHPIELLTSRTPAKADDGQEQEQKQESDRPETKREVINQASALWQRSPGDVQPEQYREFYKHLAHDWEDPLAYKHFRIEGTQMFAGIVFLPKTPRADLLDPRGDHGVRLHVRRVLAVESCDELLPKWLRFARGVVDSEDLPLNVSRETLQDSRAVRVMRKQVIQQVLGAMEEVADQRPSDYETWWQNFGPIVKEGLYFEPDFEERLTKLVRYRSTYTLERAAAHETDTSDGSSDDDKQKSKPSEWTSLTDYVSRMKADQPGIYYLEGGDKHVLSASPHLEQLKKRGYEVLLMTDGVDPFTLEKLREFDGKKLLNAQKDQLDLGDEQSEEETSDALTEHFKKVLGDKVGGVRLSKRLAESPACLVTPEGGLPPHMEAMFRAQNLEIPPTKRILEVNPEHPIVQNLRKLQLVDGDAEQLKEWMEVLYDQALIAEGSQVENPGLLAKRLTRLLTQAAERAVSTK